MIDRLADDRVAPDCESVLVGRVISAISDGVEEADWAVLVK